MLNQSPMQNPGIKPEIGMPPMASDGEKTTLSLQKYPGLQGQKVGQKVTGSFTGTITNIDDQVCEIKYDNVEIDSENSADKEMKKMRGIPNSPDREGGLEGELDL